MSTAPSRPTDNLRAVELEICKLTGFRFWSTRLTFRMRRKIRKFVEAHPRAISISCRGYSQIETLADRGIATARGESARLFIRKINPGMHAKTFTGADIEELGGGKDCVVLTAR